MTTAGTAATLKKASVVPALLARGPGCTAAANGSITHNAVAVATGAAEAEARRRGGAVYHYPPRDERRGAERSNGSSSREAMMLTRPAQSQSISMTMDALGDSRRDRGRPYGDGTMDGCDADGAAGRTRNSRAFRWQAESARRVSVECFVSIKFSLF